MKGRSQAFSGNMVAIAAALVSMIVILILTSDNPIATTLAFVQGPLANRFALGNTVSRASLLMLSGLGVIIAFRAGVFNLGGEAQVYLAAVVTSQLALYSPAPMLVAPLMGILAAALVAGVSGIARYAFDADELITTFLLAAAARPILSYLVVGPFRDTDSSLLATRLIPETARLARYLAPSSLNTSLVWAVTSVALVVATLRWTRIGYEMEMVGHNRSMARYAGIPIGLYTVLPMALSGAFHGLAGAALVMGVHHRSIVEFSGGIGWNGIAVALIARNKPVAVVPAALLFAYLEAGSRAAVLLDHSTWELGSIVQAVVFLFVTARISLRRSIQR